MIVKQNPFSFYDFLGYFTPGAIFIYWVIFNEMHLGNSPNSFIFFDNSELIIPFIFGSYLLGHILSFLSAVTIEKYSIWAYGYPSRFLLNYSTDTYFNVKGREFWVRLIVAVFLFPIFLLNNSLGYLLFLRHQFSRSLDDSLIKIIKYKTEMFISKQLPASADKYNPDSHTDFFRCIYHYTVENANNHLPKMQNYVALYGFLRTMALSGIFASWYLIYHIICNSNEINISLYIHLIVMGLRERVWVNFIFFRSSGA